MGSVTFTGLFLVVDNLARHRVIGRLDRMLRAASQAERYERHGIIPADVFWSEAKRYGVPWGAEHLTHDPVGPRPYVLDSENRRWLLDGSGDVA